MLSQKYIEHLLLKYAASPEGKAKIKRATGYDYNPKMTKEKMTAYGEQMKKILLEKIRPVIKTIEDSDIIVSEPIEKDGKMQIQISFVKERLHRKSLNPHSDGLDNIVLLFTKGYEARKAVRGEWKTSHGTITVTGVQSREPNNFLQQAVNEFNNYMGGMARAELEGAYAPGSDG